MSDVADEIRALVEMVPFTPFTVHTASLGDLRVTNPRLIRMEAGMLEIISPQAGDSRIIIPITGISSISLE